MVNEVLASCMCIPDEVVAEIQALLEETDHFLGVGVEKTLLEIGLEQRFTRLVINGHIPLPTTLTDAVTFLGRHDTTGLPPAVLKSPAMGETRGDGRGFLRRKIKAR